MSEERATRTVEESADFLAAIVGNEHQQGQRIQAGPVLEMMYETAVSVSRRHCNGRAVLLGVDRIDLTRIISHMDLVRMEGRLIEVGHSSMVIEVRVFAQRPTERSFLPSHVGYITMVAVDGEGKPVRNIPTINYDTPLGGEAKALAEHRRAQIAERRQALDWLTRNNRVHAEDVRESLEPERYEYVRPEQTVVQVKRQLVPAGYQQDQRIKGGDFLFWADRVATYTARRFTRNDHCITISMNDITFQRPLHMEDQVELRAAVVYVRSHTLEVSVEVIIHSPDGPMHQPDSLDFFIFNFHENGFKKRITTGLLLEDASQESLQRYLQARTRYEFWKSNPESHLSQSPE